MDERGIRGYLRREFGIELPEGRMFEGKKDRVFLYTGEETGLEGRCGMYIGRLKRGGFRPSTNIAPLAAKGMTDVDERQAREWMCGLDIKKEAKGFYTMIRFGRYVIGVGKPKEGVIINNLPKNRRLPLSALK